MATQITEPTEGQVDVAVDVLKLLADPTRLRIVWALLHGEHSVNDLANHVGVQASAVSQHLAKLRLARLVTTRRQGTHIYYLAVSEHARRLAEEALFHADHMTGKASSHHDAPVRRRATSERMA